VNRFDTLVQDTVELGEDYLQKTKNTQTQTYGLIYRQKTRYNEPIQLKSDVENEADIDQLITAAREKGLRQIREALQQ